jgi:hypothetical protein
MPRRGRRLRRTVRRSARRSGGGGSGTRRNPTKKKGGGGGQRWAGKKEMRRLRRTVRRSGGTMVTCIGYANDSVGKGHTQTYDDEHNKNNMCMECYREKAESDSLKVRKWDEYKAERAKREEAQREAQREDERVKREEAQREKHKAEKKAKDDAEKEANAGEAEHEQKSRKRWAEPEEID